MKLEIKPLTPELAADYFDFFDNRAFTDGSPYYPCYCNDFNLSADQIKNGLFPKSKAYGGGAEGWKRALRESAMELVLSGAIQGYLAFDGDLAVGWCNANDRLNYYRVGYFELSDVAEDVAPQDCPRMGFIKSIVCFEIAPEYRGKGIASLLLDRVCADAKREGYAFVEGYPPTGEQGALAFTGPVRLYEKAGFREVARDGNLIVMRKALKA